MRFLIRGFLLLLSITAVAEEGWQAKEYQPIKARLKSGWNTWNTRSVTCHTLLPEGFALNLAFKQRAWLEESYLKETLIGRRGEDSEKITPGPHTYDGSYTELSMSEEVGFYLNRRTDTGAFSYRLSPTLFYPLLAKLPNQSRAKRMVAEHFNNPEEFGGEFMLPSIARNDADFNKQRYWKGAIWPPLNFLTYLSLRKAGFHEAAKELSNKSLKMFLNEWERKGYVSENYSAITGTGDDERLSSNRFHSWGALFGIITFIDHGRILATELPIK